MQVKTPLLVQLIMGSTETTPSSQCATSYRVCLYSPLTCILQKFLGKTLKKYMLSMLCSRMSYSNLFISECEEVLSLSAHMVPLLCHLHLCFNSIDSSQQIKPPFSKATFL